MNENKVLTKSWVGCAIYKSVCRVSGAKILVKYVKMTCNGVSGMLIYNCSQGGQNKVSFLRVLKNEGRDLKKS